MRKTNAWQWIGIGLFAAFLLAMIAGFVWIYMAAQKAHIALDKDLCPAVGGPTEKLLVLADTTDPVADVTRRQVVAKLREIALNATTGTRVQIRALRPVEPYTQTIFDLCNPGDGSDLNELTGAPLLALKRWRQGFGEPLERALTQSIAGEGEDFSPIMAGIQAIAVDELTTAKARAIPSRLIVVSDMLENTPLFSIYTSGPDLAAFRQSPAWRHYDADLAGKGVELWVLRRDTKVPGVKLMEFWRDWIAEKRGVFLAAEQMQGVD